MSIIRIYELAKQLGVANKDLVAKINSIGIEAKSHMAMLTEEEAAKVLHEKEITILVELNSGDAEAEAFGCDLTYDYVKINGDYRT